MRVRGLKLAIAHEVAMARSHPMRVRGLKLDDGAQGAISVMSHPMRVRGLKL